MKLFSLVLVIFSVLLASHQAFAYRYFWDPNGLCMQYPDSFSATGPIKQVGHIECRKDQGSHFSYGYNNICNEYPRIIASSGSALNGRVNLNRDLCEQQCFIPGLYDGYEGDPGVTMYCRYRVRS